MAHDHAVHAPVTGRKLGLSIALTLGFVAAEAVAGYFAHSLALMSDAGHNFADALALILSWYAIRVARRPADEARTYGYLRVGILAALVNAVSLVVLALVIVWEAIGLLRAPEPVEAGPMIVVALVAMILNGIISLWLRAEARNDLNIRSAYLHMLGDAASAFGVVIAGIIVAVTGASIADPIVSLLIGGLILWSSWDILAESVNVLMEAAPRHIDMQALAKAIKDVPGVLETHDLHVWTIASGVIACSCHIVVADQSTRGGQDVLRNVAEALRQSFGVTHSTIQVEVEGCDAGEAHSDHHQ
ncbi:cation diffusion facilitator family transporter [Singulisphaera sp. PoT]|uniref:cation diffusion facilitator family transporter n=1 Tax=Singulisphaera sp. PoT TaxID=3411797 RepID=UPI003BF5F75C